MADWSWDSAKAVANRRKHGVSFELAQRVLDDPLALSRPDEHPDGDRWQSVGRPSPASGVLLLVVHTEARIVSARRATPRERRAYEQGAF